MIDGKAVRPSDVITMLNKKTVEVINTDAEGRIILADALTYGARLNPKYLIDIATLTGSVMAALGDRYSGVLGTDKELNQMLIKTGEETDELMWELPLHKDHKAKMKSKVADILNCDNGTSHLAGASKGAAFLSYFVGKNKWAHIDIAGTAFVKDPKKYEQRGATGAGVRPLLKFLEDL
jgi:leucyl aminopeptidase